MTRWSLIGFWRNWRLRSSRGKWWLRWLWLFMSIGVKISRKVVYYLVFAKKYFATVQLFAWPRSSLRFEREKGLLGTAFLQFAVANWRNAVPKPLNPVAVRRRNKKCTVAKYFLAKAKLLGIGKKITYPLWLVLPARLRQRAGFRLRNPKNRAVALLWLDFCSPSALRFTCCASSSYTKTSPLTQSGGKNKS